MMVWLSTCPLLSFHNLGPWKRFTRSFDSTGKSHHWHIAIMFIVNNLEAANVPKDLWQTILAPGTSYTPQSVMAKQNLLIHGLIFRWTMLNFRGARDLHLDVEVQKSGYQLNWANALNPQIWNMPQMSPTNLKRNGRIGASHTLRLT